MFHRLTCFTLKPEGSDRGREGGGRQLPPQPTFTADSSRHHKVFEHGSDEIFSQMLLRLSLGFRACFSCLLFVLAFTVQKGMTTFNSSIVCTFTAAVTLRELASSSDLHMYFFLFVLYGWIQPARFWYQRQNQSCFLGFRYIFLCDNKRCQH